jgi:hypothetical protein
VPSGVCTVRTAQKNATHAAAIANHIVNRSSHKAARDLPSLVIRTVPLDIDLNGDVGEKLKNGLFLKKMTPLLLVDIDEAPPAAIASHTAMLAIWIA